MIGHQVRFFREGLERLGPFGQVRIGLEGFLGGKQDWELGYLQSKRRPPGGTCWRDRVALPLVLESYGTASLEDLQFLDCKQSLAMPVIIRGVGCPQHCIGSAHRRLILMSRLQKLFFSSTVFGYNRHPPAL